METTSKAPLTYITRNYYLLTKPGILMGNAITTAGGVALAARGSFEFWIFFSALVGLSLIIASACVFNNYIDRELDQKMARTKNRALVKGLISEKSALLFAISLGVVGTALLVFYTNPLTVSIALFGFFMYVVVYSFSKTRTVHGTLIGSVAGAVPPVVGYCAVSNRLDAGALIFFAMLVFWQMPHFYAISIYRLKEYSSASIPLLPIKRGMLTTKVHMVLYIVAFIIACSMLTVFGYTGKMYLIVSTLAGLNWLWLGVRGFRTTKDTTWARKMFAYSLVVITAICFMIPFSVI